MRSSRHDLNCEVLRGESAHLPKIVACGAAGCGRLFAGNHGFGIHWSSEHEGDLGPGRRLRSFLNPVQQVDWNNRYGHARADGEDDEESEDDEGHHGDDGRGVEEELADDGSVSSGGDESIVHQPQQPAVEALGRREPRQPDFPDEQDEEGNQGEEELRGDQPLEAVRAQILLDVDPQEIRGLVPMFNQGLYKISRDLEGPPRQVVVNLIDDMIGDVPNRYQHVAAFFVVPGLVKRLRTYKERDAAKNFLNTAIERRASATEYILRFAMDVANGLRRRPQQQQPAQRRLAQKIRRVESLFSDGRLSAAVTALEDAAKFRDNQDLHQQDALTFERAREIFEGLNPLGDDQDRFPDEANAQRLVIRVETVSEVLKQLPKGSANGLSGWTCGIIHRLFADGDNADADHARLAALFTLLANGDFTQELWNVSRGVLIPKDGGRYRPIGIGESWYRVLGRAINAEVSADVGRRD